MTTAEAGTSRSDLAADILEEQAIFGNADGVERSADQFDAVFFENAAFGEFDGEVQSGLAADGGKQGVRALGGDDRFEITSSRAARYRCDWRFPGRS